MPKLESKFQANLIKEIEMKFPGSIVLKNDPNYIQGFPDLTVFYGRLWATLECKRSDKERFQPNQEYYVETLNEMGFSRVVYPENKDDVLQEMYLYFNTYSGR